MTNPFAVLTQNLAQIGIGIAGDLAAAVVYTPGGDPSYDPVSGTSTSSVTPISLRAVISRFGFHESDAQIVLLTDARMICAALDLPVEPSPNDTLVVKGKTWRVVRSMGVPGDALFKLHIREI